MLGDDGHYCHFNDVYGNQETTCIRRDVPSTSNKKRKKGTTYNVTQQHVKNVNLLIQCEECEMWRLLFSKKKLSTDQVSQLEIIIEDMAYTCRATFDDLALPEGIDVNVKLHNCYEPIEKVYYSCGYQAICIYCAGTVSQSTDEYYPQCVSCLTVKPRLKRVTRRKLNNCYCLHTHFLI